MAWARAKQFEHAGRGCGRRRRRWSRSSASDLGEFGRAALEGVERAGDLGVDDALGVGERGRRQ